jgi:hypothetical protein
VEGQGIGSIAIGYEAAQSNGQGNFAIAIGYQAHGSDSQPANSIVINANGDWFPSPSASNVAAGSLNIKPIRGDTEANLITNGFTKLYYNAITGEIQYSTT